MSRLQEIKENEFFTWYPDVQWLISEVERLDKFKQTVFSIIQVSHFDESDDAPEKALRRIENLIIESWGKEALETEEKE